MGKRKRNTPKKHKTKKTKVRVSDAPISQLNINEDDNNTNNDNSQTSQNEETINNNVKKGKPTITRTLIGSYSWGEKHKIYLPGFPNALKDNYLSVCAGKLESGAATQARSHPNKYFHNVYFEPVQIVLELARRDLKTYDILTDRGNLQRIDAAISSSVGDKDFTLYLRKHNNLLMIKRGGEEFGSNVGHMFEDALCKGSPFASSHVLVQVDVTLPSPSLSSSSTSSPSSSSNSDPSIPAPDSSTSSSAPSTSSSSSSSESTPTVSSTSSTSSLSPSSPVRLLVRAEIDAASLPFQTPRKKEYKLYKKTESDLHSYIAMHEHPLALTHLREIKMARELNVHHHFQSWLIGVNRIVHGVAKENRKLEKTLKMKDFGDRLAAVTEKLLFYSSQMSEGETYMLERKNYGPLEFSKAGEEQDEPWLQF